MLSHHQPLGVLGLYIEGVFGRAVAIIVVIIVLVLLGLGGVDAGDGARPRVVVDAAADDDGLPLIEIHDELLADAALHAEIAAGGEDDVVLGIALHIIAAVSLGNRFVDGLHRACNGCFGGVVLQGGLQSRQLIFLLLLLVFNGGDLHLQLLDAGGVHLPLGGIVVGVEVQLVNLLLQTLDVLLSKLHVQLRLLDVQLDGVGIVAEQRLSLGDGIALFHQQLGDLLAVLGINRHILLRLHHTCKHGGRGCRIHVQFRHILHIHACTIVVAAAQKAPAEEGCRPQHHHGADNEKDGFFLHGDTSCRDQ